MIIGIAGPFCSGKDVVGEMFAERGFEVISLGDVLREEMKGKNLEITRESLQNYAREMRKRVGESYPASKIAKKVDKNKNYLIQGFRNPEEAKELKKIKDFYFVSIDAPAEIRFKRMRLRARENDPVTFEEFKKIEDMEILGVGEEGFGFNISEAMAMADKTIQNDSSLEDLKRKVRMLLGELKN
jgi:dephospho-CoA kinase